MSKAGPSMTNRETALAAAIGLSTAGQLHHGVHEVISAAHRIKDFLDGNSPADKAEQQPENGEPAAAANFEVKTAVSGDGKIHAAGIGAGVDLPPGVNPKVAAGLQDLLSKPPVDEAHAAIEQKMQECPHCVELSAAFVAAGHQPLTTQVVNIKDLPLTLIDTLHEKGLTHLFHLLKLSPFDVMRMSKDAGDAMALMKYLMPLKLIELEFDEKTRDDLHAVSDMKSVSAYGDINLDQFSDLDRLTVNKLSAQGITTIGQLVFNPAALVEHLKDANTPAGLNLLSHVATCMEKEIEDRPDISEAVRLDLKARSALMKRLIDGAKATVEATEVVKAQEPAPAAQAEEQPAALKNLLKDIEKNATLVGPGVFAVDVRTPEGKALIDALNSVGAEQPFEMTPGGVRIKSARVNGKDVAPDAVASLLAELIGRGGRPRA